MQPMAWGFDLQSLSIVMQLIIDLKSVDRVVMINSRLYKTTEVKVSSFV